MNKDELALAYYDLRKVMEQILYGGPSIGSMRNDEVRGNEFEREILRVRKLAEESL